MKNNGIIHNTKTFKRRMKRIGIKIEYAANMPWIYITKINGKTVTDKYYSEHYFTIGLVDKYGGFSFTKLPGIFKIIRKYKLDAMSN